MTLSLTDAFLTNRSNAYESYEYDDENRLTAVQVYNTEDNEGWRTVFEYDGLGRLRWRLEYVPQTGFRPVHPLDDGSWSFDHGVEYIYDGWRVIQERAENNTPQVSYTVLLRQACAARNGVFFPRRASSPASGCQGLR
jgi:YD repeat-containing protein